MSKVKVNGVEMDTNSIAYANVIIESLVSSVILEAVKHFETSRPRSYEDDSRFFYKESELDMFWKLFKGDPNSLKCTTIFDNMGGVFCYEICRVERKNRIRAV